MKARKAGSRHSLLLYRRVMERLWPPTLLLGGLLLGLWAWSWYWGTPLLPSQNDLWLLTGAGVSLGFALFAFFGRRVAYVQPRRDHLRLVTPFLRLNISYRRVLSAHPSAFSQLFPPQEASWAQRRLLAPFYGQTAVVLELSRYPLPPFLLRFFLMPQMFSPHTTALVLLLPDWLAFSTELDSFMGAWQQLQKRRSQ